MLLLGIDLGTSSIKVSVVDAASRSCIAAAQYPETEVDIIATQPGWAEQSPDLWWEHVKQAILKCNASGSYDPRDITAIGISYQMHGLVAVDERPQVAVVVLIGALSGGSGRRDGCHDSSYGDVLTLST